MLLGLCPSMLLLYFSLVCSQSGYERQEKQVCIWICNLPTTCSSPLCHLSQTLYFCSDRPEALVILAHILFAHLFTCSYFWKMTIKNFQIEYDSINSQNIFTNGDTINGRIVVEASKETSIQSLTFIGKGSAKVCWHEYYGQYSSGYFWSDEKYYEIKQRILRAGTDCIPKGRHVFPFSFKVPNRKMPSSFKSSVGKIVHKLKAELKQSMKLTKKAKAHFAFVSKADMTIPGLMEPQHDCTDKKITVFGSGIIAMDVHTQRMGYHPGKRNVCTQNILKETLESIAPHSNRRVKKVITIPRSLPPSILNSSIIQLEYRLKIFLGVKYAINPEIKLPIVVLPDFEDPAGKQPPGPAAAYRFEQFGTSRKQSWSKASQSSDLPPPYGAHAEYPYLSDYKYQR
ncbi:arrestin domain-containing protein 3-like isoform X2 [Hippocampus zosterae]|uniref:arrestin domain-containing protein 3-like isoform X2 n=1 Tax=Hippocampus zosterae TaxID=109293 RepID=UPI00223D4519|nr:arrestin domain-containing protein 3-like isoform X2 [Hippocampus zosterae]